MNLYANQIQNVELPIIYIASLLGIWGKYIYGIVVLIAIFTTAVSTGYGFLNNISKTRKKYLIFSIIICIISVFIGQIGFADLINILYPVFGYLGIIQIIFLLIS